MRAAFNSLDLFSWHPEQSMVTLRDVEQMHEDHIAVFPYTVNALKDVNRLTQMNVDGMFTDDPDLMIHHLAGTMPGPMGQDLYFGQEE